MKKSDYLAQRAKLRSEAQSLIDSGDVTKANAKIKDIKLLDEKFENAATAQANLEALNGVAPKGMVNFGEGAKTGTNEAKTDVYASVEYRQAFMDFIIRGKAIPAKFQNTNQTTTSDPSVAGVIVPTTLYEKIFFKLESKSGLYARVFKTNYPTALVIPVSSVRPTAVWVDEDKGSDRQNFTIDKVQFSGYKLECRTAFSLFMSVVALDKFEAQFIEVITDAMVKAINKSIAIGSGVGAPKGILTELIDSSKTVEIAAADSITYDTMVETESKVDSAYDGVDTVYLMTKKTFMRYYGITDEVGQPIARVNAGIDGKPRYNILGRDVETLDGIMDNYADTVTEDTTVAAIFNLKDYVFNEVMGIAITRFIDQDTDQTVIKAVMLADGKVVDKTSLVKVVKKSS